MVIMFFHVSFNHQFECIIVLRLYLSLLSSHIGGNLSKQDVCQLFSRLTHFKVDTLVELDQAQPCLWTRVFAFCCFKKIYPGKKKTKKNQKKKQKKKNRDISEILMQDSQNSPQLCQRGIFQYFDGNSFLSSLFKVIGSTSDMCLK